MPTQKFWVKGLEHADEARVARAARGVEGVLFAVANHSDQCAEVEFEDDRVTVAEIRDAIAALGYRVEVAG
jgi:copper chaperone CopZ